MNRYKYMENETKEGEWIQIEFKCPLCRGARLPDDADCKRCLGKGVIIEDQYVMYEQI